MPMCTGACRDPSPGIESVSMSYPYSQALFHAGYPLNGSASRASRTRYLGPSGKWNVEA